MGCSAYIVGFVVQLLQAGRQAGTNAGTVFRQAHYQASQYTSQKLFILIVFTILD